jgi:small GTP-binding protein
LIIICADLSDDDQTLNSKIAQIQQKFSEFFKIHLNNGNLPSNPNLYNKIKGEIDRIVLGSIKVAIIGTGGVGKEDLRRLITGKENNLEYTPTINVEITEYDGKESNIPVPLTLWDFAGQANFRSLWKSLLESADIALLVMDSSYENVKQCKEIIHDILDKYYKDILIIGIANKQDLPHRLTPKFCERILSEADRHPPIKVHGMDATNPQYREKILSILRDAYQELYPDLEIENFDFNFSGYLEFNFKYDFNETLVDIKATVELNKNIDALNKILREWELGDLNKQN